MDSFNIGSIVISLSSFAIYHIITYGAVYNRSKSIKLYKNLINSKHWVQKHKLKDDAPNVTLAIQTLRNTILVAIFLGGGAFTSAFNTLNDLGDSSNSYNLVDKTRQVILSILLMLSFLGFASVIRAASHLGYQLGTIYKKALRHEPSSDTIQVLDEIDLENSKKDDDSDDINIVKESNQMAAVMIISFNLGFRFMYIAVAFTFYSLGPVGLDIGTGIMLIFLYFIDHSF